MDSPWTMKSLKRLNSGGVYNLDPSRCKSEEFEYYSIPAYQEGRQPVQVLGETILSQKLVISERCILFGKLNPRVEKVWFVNSASEKRRLASTEWLPIMPTAEVNQAYLYFVLWSDWVMPIAQNLVSGSTPSRERVEPKSFYEIEVPIPPKPEQAKIAAVLWKIQRAIEVEEKLVATARELKQAAMRQLFTRGLRGEPQKETEIGPIPESWRLNPLESCCEVVSSSISYTDFLLLNEGDSLNSCPAMGIKVSDMNLPGNELRMRKAKLEKQISKELAVRKLVPPETIVFPKRGAAIATNKKRMTTVWTVLDPNLIGVRAGNGVDSGYLFHWFQNFDLRNITEPGPTPQLNKKNLTPLLLPIPTDIHEQQEIASILNSIDRKITLHSKKQAVLQDLFKTMLHKLMTGEIRVADLEIDTSEVTA